MALRNLRQSNIRDILSKKTDAELRTDLTTGHSADLRRRRAIVGLSMVGMAAMGAVTLLQTGVLGHLPDPPGERFDSDAANLSDEAFESGVPDAALDVRTLASNLPLATIGGERRARERPWLSLIASGKAAVAAGGAADRISSMIRDRTPWSPYVLTSAAASIGIFALTVPEAATAVRTIWNWLVDGD